MKQKKVFLHSEGDAWFFRNQKSLSSRKLPDADPLLVEIINIQTSDTSKKLKVLEVGCGDGTRLEWLRNNLDADCFGVEPSPKAVAEAVSKGLNVIQGTADVLPFEDQSFDIVIFAFCLYLCDREDLFLIASSADRVLRQPGWLAILDFYSPEPRANNYHHRSGLSSFKMDYRDLFSWHPNYQCMTHKVRHHIEFTYTDQIDEWIAISLMRKNKR